MPRSKYAINDVKHYMKMNIETIAKEVLKDESKEILAQMSESKLKMLNKLCNPNTVNTVKAYLRAQKSSGSHEGHSFEIQLVYAMWQRYPDSVKSEVKFPNMIPPIDVVAEFEDFRVEVSCKSRESFDKEGLGFRFAQKLSELGRSNGMKGDVTLRMLRGTSEQDFKDVFSKIEANPNILCDKVVDFPKNELPFLRLEHLGNDDSQYDVIPFSPTDTLDTAMLIDHETACRHFCNAAKKSIGERGGHCEFSRLDSDLNINILAFEPPLLMKCSCISALYGPIIPIVKFDQDNKIATRRVTNWNASAFKKECFKHISGVLVPHLTESEGFNFLPHPDHIKKALAFMEYFPEFTIPIEIEQAWINTVNKSIPKA